MGMNPVLKAFGLAEEHGGRAARQVCRSPGVAMAANYHLALTAPRCFIAAWVSQQRRSLLRA